MSIEFKLFQFFYLVNLLLLKTSVGDLQQKSSTSNKRTHVCSYFAGRQMRCSGSLSDGTLELYTLQTRFCALCHDLKRMLFRALRTVIYISCYICWLLLYLRCTQMHNNAHGEWSHRAQQSWVTLEGEILQNKITFIGKVVEIDMLSGNFVIHQTVRRWNGMIKL